MNIQKYKILLTVLETGSITQTALLLSYSQSAVTLALQSLEKDWGFRIFERHKARFVPTEHTKTLFPYIYTIVNAQHALDSSVSQLHNLQTGMLRFGCYTSLAMHWLPDALHRFHQQHPNIEVSIFQGSDREILEWLYAGSIDLALVGDTKRTDLEKFPITSDQYVAVLPSDHPYAQAEAVPWSVFGEGNLILMDDDTTTVSDMLRKKHIHAHVLFSIREDRTILSLVEGGEGITILPELLLKRNPYRVVVKPIADPITRLLYVIRRKHQLHSPAADRFFRFLKEE